MSSEIYAYNRWRKQQGLPLAPMKLPKTVHTVSISETAWQSLEELAASHGLNHGGSGNISALMESIGQGLFVVTPDSDWSPVSDE